MNDNIIKKREMNKTTLSKLIILIIIKNNYAHELYLNDILELKTV